MSFILDALRKSEHERQRSALPGLAQVPLATPPAQLPRWALVVIGVLGASVLLLGAAWWQSTRVPAGVAARTSSPMVERNVQLPQPAPPPARYSAPTEPPPVRQQTLSPPQQTELAAAATPSPDSAPPPDTADSSEPALPSAAALAAEGIALPQLRLELHAFGDQPRDRFVFINGRKYLEGERLVEGPQLVAIEPRGAVLAQAGRRFLLVPE